MQTCPLQSCRGVRAAVTNSGVQARAPSRRGPRGGSHVARPVADGEAGGAGGWSELQARAARPRRVSRDVRHLTRTARWHLGVHSAVHPPPLPSSEILPSPPERAACPPRAHAPRALPAPAPTTPSSLWLPLFWTCHVKRLGPGSLTSHSVLRARPRGCVQARSPHGSAAPRGAGGT